MRPATVWGRPYTKKSLISEPMQVVVWRPHITTDLCQKDTVTDTFLKLLLSTFSVHYSDPVSYSLYLTLFSERSRKTASDRMVDLSAEIQLGTFQIRSSKQFGQTFGSISSIAWLLNVKIGKKSSEQEKNHLSMCTVYSQIPSDNSLSVYGSLPRRPGRTAPRNLRVLHFFIV